MSATTTRTTRQPSRPTPKRPISVLLFFFVFGFFFAVVGGGDDLVLFFVAGSGRWLSLGELRILDRLRLDDDARAPARGGHHRRFIGIPLIGAAFRALRNRLAEVVELRVAAITGVLLSQLRHRCVALRKKRRNGNTNEVGGRRLQG